MINKNEDFLQLGQHVRTYVCNPGRPTASNGLHLKCAELNLFFTSILLIQSFLNFQYIILRKTKKLIINFFKQSILKKLLHLATK